MSRIDSGMMTITSEPFSAVRLVDEVQNIMASEARKYDLEFEIHKKIKDDILAGDAVRLKQVLMNLISNAFKFTPAEVLYSSTQSRPETGMERQYMSSVWLITEQGYQRRTSSAFLKPLNRRGPVLPRVREPDWGLLSAGLL